jgi:hypothetical protein
MVLVSRLEGDVEMNLRPASDQGQPPSDREAGEARSHYPTGLGKLLAAYRGQLTRAEAARRAGLPVERWAQVEADPAPVVPAHTVATMCAAVGADVATGLKLAGHDPDRYSYLIMAPPGLMHLRPTLSPIIANYRAVSDVVASPEADPRAPLSAIYRETAATNRRLADDLLAEPPDDRAEFWAGYAAALRALAEEQLRVAEQDAGR